MRTTIVMASLLVFISLIVTGQEFIEKSKNTVDENGLRQGKWKVYDEAGNLKFKGQFKDDIPYGEFKFYFTKGSLKAISNIFDSGQSSYTKTFHKNGFLMAEGKYVNREKDSLWKYYSKYDENLLLAEEYYVNNNREGVWINYYPNGEVAEEINYENDKKNGLWKQYYNDGSIKLKATYENGDLEGLFTVYFPNGVVNISGTYNKGMKTGTWMFFNDKAEKVEREIYENGVMVDKEVYVSEPNENIEKVEEQEQH